MKPVLGGGAMEKLGLFDQVFYKADQYSVLSMVMSGASVLEPSKRGERLDARAIADHLAARLEKITLMRAKFVQDPLRLGTVHRVEDPAFDIRDHIAVSTVPRPGSYSELTARLGELCSEPLKLSQVWKWTVLDGLAGGRVVIFCRVHHALADGIGIGEALSSIYDAHPVRPEQPSGTAGRPSADEPTRMALLRRAIGENAYRLVIGTPRFLGSRAIPMVSDLVARLKESSASGDRRRWETGHRTSLNIGMPAERRLVAYKTLPKQEVRALARHFDCKINDICLLLYSFAMQEYLDGVGERPDFDLTCGVPLSTRSGDAVGGNQVTVGMVSLHNTIADVEQRLAAIKKDTRDMKELSRPEQPIAGVDELASLVPPFSLDLMLFLENRLGLSEKLLERFSMLHAVFSNVPGPAERCFVANAELVDNIPLIPAAGGVAVSGGVSSAEKCVTIGFNCDGEAIRDKELFVKGVERGFKALTAAMQPAGRSPRKGGRKPAAGRRRKAGSSRKG